MLFVGNGAVDRENLLCKGIAIMHVTKGTSTCASASCCSGEGALTSNFLRRRNGTICIIYFAAYKTALDTGTLYNKNNKVASNFIYNGQFVSVVHEIGYNGLPVYI